MRIFGWLAVAFVIACSDAATDDPPPRTCGISQAAAEHACVHGGSGPFAAESGDAPVELVPHTVHTIAGSPDLWLRAGRRGLWGVFFSPATSVAGFFEDERPRPWELMTAHTGCEHFQHAVVVRLNEGERLLLRFGRPPGVAVRVLAERLGPGWASVARTDGCHASQDAAAADASHDDAGVVLLDALSAPVCRSSGPCQSDEECCGYCHDQDHCH